MKNLPKEWKEIIDGHLKFIDFYEQANPQLSPKESRKQATEYYKKSVKYFSSAAHVKHREKCWINYFMSELGLVEKWTKAFCKKNNINYNSLYSLNTKPMTEKEFDKVCVVLEDNPDAIKNAEYYFKNNKTLRPKK